MDELTPELIPHPRFERLWVTDDGRVFHQKITGGRLSPIRESKQGPAGNGYMQIIVTREGKRQTLAVHRLVCETFHPETWFEGAYACHENGNPLDNRASNLRWDTALGNMHDKWKHGTVGPGSTSYRTHCPQGHEFTEENTYRNGRGRFCRTCRRERQQARNQRVNAKRDELAARLQQVSEIHLKHKKWNPRIGRAWCLLCNEEWPCGTARAVDADPQAWFEIRDKTNFDMGWDAAMDSLSRG